MTTWHISWFVHWSTLRRSKWCSFWQGNRLRDRKTGKTKKKQSSTITVDMFVCYSTLSWPRCSGPDTCGYH